MNCKPGDLAMIVRSIHPVFLGRMVTVHNVIDTNRYGACWSYSGNLHVEGRAIEYVEDCCLKAIRDPGDDAVDEMVQLCGNATARTA
jgi:hypothetical protein